MLDIATQAVLRYRKIVLQLEGDLAKVLDGLDTVFDPPVTRIV